jgi:hypothetical protein
MPRVLSFTSIQRDITGAGASWSIRIPRVIDLRGPLLRLIQVGDYN